MTETQERDVELASDPQGALPTLIEYARSEPRLLFRPRLLIMFAWNVVGLELGLLTVVGYDVHRGMVNQPPARLLHAIEKITLLHMAGFAVAAILTRPRISRRRLFYAMVAIAGITAGCATDLFPSDFFITFLLVSGMITTRYGALVNQIFSQVYPAVTAFLVSGMLLLFWRVLERR